MKSIDQIVDEIADKFGPEELCKHCIYGVDCPGPIANYGYGPVFGPCSDGNPEDWFDLDSYKEED